MELKQIPLGFHFRPKPQECCEYLICKVASKPLPCDGVILDLNPYDAKQLDEIFKSVEKRDEHGLFTFTKLRKRTSKMHGYDCPRRKVGKGIWHPEKTIDQGSVAVEGEEHTYIGSAQKLSYREKGSKKDRRFLMMEYSLFEGQSCDRQSDDGTPVKYDPYKDYVLCHVVKKETCNLPWFCERLISSSMSMSMSMSHVLSENGPQYPSNSKEHLNHSFNERSFPWMMSYSVI